MDYKAQLGIIVDAVMKGQMDEAKTAFHSLSVAKTQDLVRVTEAKDDDVKDKASKGKKDAKAEGDNDKSPIGGKGDTGKDNDEKSKASKGKKDAKDEGDNDKPPFGGKGNTDKDTDEKKDGKKGKKDADEESDKSEKGKGFVPFQKKDKKD